MLQPSLVRFLSPRGSLTSVKFVRIRGAIEAKVGLEGALTDVLDCSLRLSAELGRRITTTVWEERGKVLLPYMLRRSSSRMQQVPELPEEFFEASGSPTLAVPLIVSSISTCTNR